MLNCVGQSKKIMHYFVVMYVFISIYHHLVGFPCKRKHQLVQNLENVIAGCWVRQLTSQSFF